MYSAHQKWNLYSRPTVISLAAINAVFGLFVIALLGMLSTRQVSFLPSALQPTSSPLPPPAPASSASSASHVKQIRTGRGRPQTQENIVDPASGVIECPVGYEKVNTNITEDIANWKWWSESEADDEEEDEDAEVKEKDQRRIPSSFSVDKNSLALEVPAGSKAFAIYESGVTGFPVTASHALALMNLQVNSSLVDAKGTIQLRTKTGDVLYSAQPELLQSAVKKPVLLQTPLTFSSQRSVVVHLGLDYTLPGHTFSFKKDQTKKLEISQILFCVSKEKPRKLETQGACEDNLLSEPDFAVQTNPAWTKRGLHAKGFRDLPKVAWNKTTMASVVLSEVWNTRGSTQQTLFNLVPEHTYTVTIAAAKVPVVSEFSDPGEYDSLPKRFTKQIAKEYEHMVYPPLGVTVNGVKLSNLTFKRFDNESANRENIVWFSVTGTFSPATPGPLDLAFEANCNKTQDIFTSVPCAVEITAPLVTKTNCS